MKGLFLADLKRKTEAEIKQHIACYYTENSKYSYQPEAGDVERLLESLNNYKVLIAYESVGDFGCDSSSFFLLERKSDRMLFENHGNHCSCYGFEGQWRPEETTIEYLKSDRFYFYTGGYDGKSKQNEADVKDFLNRLYNRK